MSCCWNNPRLLPGSRAEGRLPVVTSYDLLDSHPSTPGQGNRAGLAHRFVVYRLSPIGVVAGRDVPPCSCEGERLAAQLGSAQLRRRRRGRRTSARRQSPMRFHVPRQAGELAGLAVVGLAQLRGQPHGVALPQTPSLSPDSPGPREPGHHVVDRLTIGSTHRWPPIGSSGFPRSGSLPQGSRDRADGVIVQTGLSDASLVAPAVEGWRQRGRNEGTSLREDAGYDAKR